MWEWLDVFRATDVGLGPSMGSVCLALLLAFVIGQLIAWVYMATHASLSYSATFVSSLVVLPVVVSLMMFLVSSNVAVAFGLLAVFAVVRFRNVLRDTRDAVYIMWAMVQGMAAGTCQYSTAAIGAVFVALVFLYIWATRFGYRSFYDAAVSLQIKQNVEVVRGQIESILKRHTDRFVVTNERTMSDSSSHLSFRLLLKNSALREELRRELMQLPDVQNLTLFLQEDEGEV